MSFAKNILALLLLSSIVGCASGPPRGVRAPYSEAQTQKVVIVQVEASSHFGLTDSQRDALEWNAHTEIASWLMNKGVDVVTLDHSTRYLRSLEESQDFLDAMPEDSLRHTFEPDQSITKEVEYLRKAGSPFGDVPLLFVELAYYTEGDCREKAAGEHVVTRNVGPSKTCLVTHLRAKLVDPLNAQTMWENHVLMERYSDIDPKARAKNLEDTVHFLFTGKHGLLSLLEEPRESSR